MIKNSTLVTNNKIKALTDHLNVLEVLDTIDIESIQDLNTNIICRTIKNSVETLKQHLQESI